MKGDAIVGQDRIVGAARELQPEAHILGDVGRDNRYTGKDAVERAGTAAPEFAFDKTWNDGPGSFATPEEQRDVRDIERLIKKALPPSKLPAGLPPAREPSTVRPQSAGRRYEPSLELLACRQLRGGRVGRRAGRMGGGVPGSGAPPRRIGWSNPGRGAAHPKRGGSDFALREQVTRP